MKRIILVLAFGLILVVSLGGQAFPRMQPFDYQSPCLDGDEHTWGGEQEGGVPDLGYVIHDPSHRMVTGFIRLDVFLNSFFLKLWLVDDTRTGVATRATYYVKPIHHDSYDGKLEANSNNKGN
jgi:hypothetical protein